MTVVYAPSAKALRNKAFKQGDRFVFLGGGSIATWNGDSLIQSDVLYRKPDSHCQKTSEKLPSKLFATPYEADHVKTNKIKLPFALEVRN